MRGGWREEWCAWHSLCCERVRGRRESEEARERRACIRFPEKREEGKKIDSVFVAICPLAQTGTIGGKQRVDGGGKGLSSG